VASEAKLKGNKKYLEKQDDIKIRVPKGKRDIISAYVQKKGIKSLNAYIVGLIDEDMRKG
jgi:hypothetical protein